MAPLILARTSDNSVILGTVQSVLGLGGLAGGLILSIWGGPKRRVHGVLLGMAGAGPPGVTGMGLARTLPFWAAAAFATMFFNQILNASNQAIWQAKLDPDVQGRVFAVRRLIATFGGTRGHVPIRLSGRLCL